MMAARHNADPKHQRMMNSPPVAPFSSGRRSVLIFAIHQSVSVLPQKRLVSESLQPAVNVCGAQTSKGKIE
jgi:hypothetical protein